MQFCKFSMQNGRKRVTKRLEKMTKRGFLRYLLVQWEYDACKAQGVEPVHFRLCCSFCSQKQELEALTAAVSARS